MTKAKPKLDPFASCCGTCAFSHMNEHRELTCWGNPPVFAGHYEEDEPVFHRGQGLVKAIDPPCYFYTPKNPQ